MQNNKESSDHSVWRERLRQTLFDENTYYGKVFDGFLFAIILLSLLVVILGSLEEINNRYGSLIFKTELIFTAFFFLEYILRIFTAKKPLKYAFSFYGIIDFLAFMPLFLELMHIGGIENLITIRTLRLLRIFRLFKLYKFVYEADIMRKAIRASLKRIIVFLFTVLTLITLIGTLIYAIEGPRYGFTDIPTGIYWTIVTITTVGFGDIAPQTFPGKLLASLVMLLGYGMIAVPTGIVTVEYNRISKLSSISQVCLTCGGYNDSDAVYCKYCGTRL